MVPLNKFSYSLTHTFNDAVNEEDKGYKLISQTCLLYKI